MPGAAGSQDKEPRKQMHDLNAVPQFLATMFAEPRHMVLVLLLVIAAVIDLRTYRIPNWLTVSGMLFGLAYNAISASSAVDGLLAAFGGLVLGLVILLPVYALGVLGAGDVKLMAMVGGIVGVPDIIYAALWALITGGVAAIGFALYRRAFRRMTANVAQIVQSMALAAMAGVRPAPAIAGRASVGKLPYGVSIAAGTIAWLAARQFGFA